MISLNNVMEMKKFNYKLEIDIFRNSTQKNLCVLSTVSRDLARTRPTCLLDLGSFLKTPVWTGKNFYEDFLILTFRL